MSNRFLVSLLLAAAVAAGCAPKLATPGEATRISGRVDAPGDEPVHVVALERCSSSYYFFEKCPGRFLGEAKLWKPGPFVIEFDTEQDELVLFAFRGEAGVERQCTTVTLPTAQAGTPLTLTLTAGHCGSQSLHSVEGVGAPPPPAGATSSPAPPLDSGGPL
jgi:hypothetical protein